jgi:hypothetical protein
MPATDIHEAEARLPRWMAALAALATVAALSAGRPRFAGGFLLGAALALVNYFWLHQAVVHLMQAVAPSHPRALIAKFLLRYPLILGSIFLVHRTGWISLSGLLAGLFVPVGGVLLESLLQIRDGVRRR